MYRVKIPNVYPFPVLTGTSHMSSFGRPSLKYNQQPFSDSIDCIAIQLIYYPAPKLKKKIFHIFALLDIPWWHLTHASYRCGFVVP